MIRVNGTPDAVVVGSGPNGLVAAVTMAQAGRRTLLVEAAGTVGGGLRTEELTLPGFRHDVCATVLPLTLGSPAFRGLHLEEDGVGWAHPPVAAAHPLDGGDAVLVCVAVTQRARTRPGGRTVIACAPAHPTSSAPG